MIEKMFYLVLIVALIVFTDMGGIIKEHTLAIHNYYQEVEKEKQVESALRNILKVGYKEEEIGYLDLNLELHDMDGYTIKNYEKVITLQNELNGVYRKCEKWNMDSDLKFAFIHIDSDKIVDLVYSVNLDDTTYMVFCIMDDENHTLKSYTVESNNKKIKILPHEGLISIADRLGVKTYVAVENKEFEILNDENVPYEQYESLKQKFDLEHFVYLEDYYFATYSEFVNELFSEDWKYYREYCYNY